MNCLSRALISITRNYKKSVLLFLMIVLLGSLISGTISTNIAVENTIDNLERNMLPVLTFEANWEMYLEFLESIGETEIDGRWWAVPLHTVRKIGELPYVKLFDYSANFMLFNPDLAHYKIDMTEEGDIVFCSRRMSCPELGDPFHLRGVRGSRFIDMEENLIELVSGRLFTYSELEYDSSVALVSQEFAYLNQLTIGSSFTLTYYLFEGGYATGPYIFAKEDAINSWDYDLRVVGIFQPVIKHNLDDPWTTAWLMEETNNRIYTPNNFIETISEATIRMLVEEGIGYWGERENMDNITLEDMVWYRHLFVLESPHYFSDFQQAIEDILPPYFTIIDANSEFRVAASAVESMRALSSFVLWMSVSASIFILTLLIMLFLRDRKTEIGIYLSLGEKRVKIIWQTIFEVLLISSLGLLFALIIGNIFAGNLSSIVLLNEIENQQGNGMAVGFNELISLGFAQLHEMSVECIIANYSTSLNLRALLLFLSISLGSIIFATIVPIFYLLRLNPKKVMI